MVKKASNIDIIDAIKQAVRVVFQEMGVVTKDDLKYLPSREEFYKREDEIMGELKTMREEHTMLSNRIYNDQVPRLEKLEKIHPQGRHFAAI
ncbi:MAG: hypothetical protein UU32_C0012G0003 [Candidatus Woesebacteria bacterium GW2011_GWB1_41_10]|uniref:Uncharacterized protein n=1 Tax=Candidatus Woesebacteria bacterium GW2011_GWB1_41_10 TaxID=1618577 RepID=A0A0G0WQF8_9BACT|nr:MAG: hypothetical protein UU32_C0012G0003 [Candidatus Woesebacteria bacterium GW2011_GWB1_41_10]